MIRNKLSKQSDAERRVAYDRDRLMQKKAFFRDGMSIFLDNIAVDRVEFIGGLWRVQDRFDHPIQVVRDREYVLGEKLNRIESNRFEYYRAMRVCNNCYGLSCGPEICDIVAKYETDNGTYWAYGDTIEQARAFLGIRLYDKYMDVIHTAECQKKLQNKK